jgi:hypothetical protein
MTRLEMHAEFKLLMDKGDSLDAPSFLETEIDSFLNISQDKFISKRAFGNNPRRTTFEEDQKRRDDLRNLIKNGVITPSSYDSALNKPNGLFFELPTDYRHAINEEALTEDSHRISVKPVTHDRYNKIIDDPFNKPTLKSVYRLDYSGDLHELICESIISEYHLRYIANPPEIAPDIDGVAQDCILADHTHREIVKMAVLEALENVEQPRYQSSKLELNEIE